jgi:putative flippase GtrA
MAKLKTTGAHPASLIRQIRRFIGAGAARTLLTLGFYQLLLLAAPYWLAYTLSFITGVLLAALVNSHFVFETGLELRGAVRFTFFYVASYVLGLTLLSALVADFAIPAAFAAFIVIPLMLPINFFGSRLALKPS